MSAGQWLVPLGYLFGSIPFGLLISRALKGVDVRRVGSGNIGATNVLRAAGSGPALLTLTMDVLKGWVPVAVALSLGGPEALVASVALAAFLGHLFPVFLGFRGGKGVATFLGILLALVGKLAVLIVGIWLLTVALVRYSSVAALVAAAATPPLVWLFDGRPPYVILTAVLSGFILIRHKDNLRRLVAGEEGKIGQKANAADAELSRRNGIAS